MPSRSSQVRAHQAVSGWRSHLNRDKVNYFSLGKRAVHEDTEEMKMKGYEGKWIKLCKRGSWGCVPPPFCAPPTAAHLGCARQVRTWPPANQVSVGVAHLVSNLPSSTGPRPIKINCLIDFPFHLATVSRDGKIKIH